MVNKYKFKIFINPGATREQDCCCSAYDPGCERGYNGECILIKYTYNPFNDTDIEECRRNETRTYEKRHGRFKSKRV